jgi:hypothetical protein
VGELTVEDGRSNNAEAEWIRRCCERGGSSGASILERVTGIKGKKTDTSYRAGVLGLFEWEVGVCALKLKGRYVFKGGLRIKEEGG